MLLKDTYDMDDKLSQETMSYYDERAQEYDEIYLGKGPTAIPHSIAYKNDVREIKKMVSVFGKGHLIDIGCGTGFWLPDYARNCLRMTLIDQSEKMLTECKSRVDKLGLRDKSDFIQGDFFGVIFKNQLFDSTLVGFIISHISLELEQAFFAKLKKILKPNAQLMIIDGAWNRKRQQYRKKEGIQERTLNDGRIFRIYKRYFNKSDIEEKFDKYRFKFGSCYIGEVFLAVIGRNHE